jgi:hypothetical protein
LQLLNKFSSTSDSLAEISESLCFKNEESVFSTLSVFGKYVEAAKEMLNKRIGLLAE